MKLEIVEIGDLPLFNADLEANPPPAAVAFKARVKKADAVLFVRRNTTGQCRVH